MTLFPTIFAGGKTRGLAQSPGVRLLVLLAAALTCGCAAEAPPHPPRIQTPQVVKDLAATQIGTAVILSFTLPDLATDGRRLTKPLEVEIFRSVAQPGAGVSPPMMTKPWAVITADDLRSFKHGEEVRYPAGPSANDFARLLQTSLAFRVVSLTRGFRGHPHRSAPSNTAAVELMNVSPAISGLKIRQIPGAIRLAWAQPRESVVPGAARAPIRGYRVYRSSVATSGAFRLLGEVSLPVYEDRQFQFGSDYVYRVRAVFGRGPYLSMSADSMPVGIVPRPIFPPPAPTGLMAVYTGTEVNMGWTPEAGLAGYNVYREATGGRRERLNSQLLREPAFSDRSVSLGKTYIYWVTAVDEAGHESTASSPATVEVR